MAYRSRSLNGRFIEIALIRFLDAIFQHATFLVLYIDLSKEEMAIKKGFYKLRKNRVRMDKRGKIKL